MREARELLGVEQDATEETIRETWKVMMHRTHPDKGGSAPLFRMVREAGELLLSEKSRAGSVREPMTLLRLVPGGSARRPSSVQSKWRIGIDERTQRT